MKTEVSLGLELAAKPKSTQIQVEEKPMKSNSKSNFMKSVKGGIVAILEHLVGDSNPSEKQVFILKVVLLRALP